MQECSIKFQEGASKGDPNSYSSLPTLVECMCDGTSHSTEMQTARDRAKAPNLQDLDKTL